MKRFLFLTMAMCLFIAVAEAGPVDRSANAPPNRSITIQEVNCNLQVTVPQVEYVLRNESFTLVSFIETSLGEVAVFPEAAFENSTLCKNLFGFEDYNLPDIRRLTNDETDNLILSKKLRFDKTIGLIDPIDKYTICKANRCRAVSKLT